LQHVEVVQSVPLLDQAAKVDGLWELALAGQRGTEGILLAIAAGNI